MRKESKDYAENAPIDTLWENGLEGVRAGALDHIDERTRVEKDLGKASRSGNLKRRAITAIHTVVTLDKAVEARAQESMLE